jgi:hypothetical protein
MLIPLENGNTIDTDSDLSAEERHILQKLFGWKTMVTSLSEFREKTAESLYKGWNNSGPIRESKILSTIIVQLEMELIQKLKTKKET